MLIGSGEDRTAHRRDQSVSAIPEVYLAGEGIERVDAAGSLCFAARQIGDTPPVHPGPRHAYDGVLRPERLGFFLANILGYPEIE